MADATRLIHDKAQGNSLYGKEVQAVTVEAIQEGERRLLEGINFDMICYHPIDAIRRLSSEIGGFLSDFHRFGYFAQYGYAIGEDVQARAQNLCYRALVGSDALFLFPPGRLAYAVTTIALRSIHCEGLTGYEMEAFLRFRFPSTPKKELETFEQDIGEIVRFLTDCPQMELTYIGPSEIWNEAEEVRQVLNKVSKIRSQRLLVARKERQNHKSRPKRARLLASHQSRKMSKWTRKMCPKVTPISQS